MMLHFSPFTNLFTSCPNTVSSEVSKNNNRSGQILAYPTICTGYMGELPKRTRYSISASRVSWANASLWFSHGGSVMASFLCTRVLCLLGGGNTLKVDTGWQNCRTVRYCRDIIVKGSSPREQPYRSTTLPPKSTPTSSVVVGKFRDVHQPRCLPCAFALPPRLPPPVTFAPIPPCSTQCSWGVDG
jgi:hypothetical protein